MGRQEGQEMTKPKEVVCENLTPQKTEHSGGTKSSSGLIVKAESELLNHRQRMTLILRISFSKDLFCLPCTIGWFKSL